MISFTFDDFFESAASSGAGILENYGKRGTFYISSSLLGNTLPGFSENIASAYTIETLHSRGHEIGFHTKNHVDLSKSSRLTIMKEMIQGNTIKKITGIKSTNFSYPYGRSYSRLDTFAKLLGYTTTRGVKTGLNNRSDRFSLCSIPIYGHSLDEKSIADLICKTVSDNMWLIFYTHDVINSHSRFGCNELQFNSVVKQAMSSKARILTIQEVVNLSKLPSNQ